MVEEIDGASVVSLLIGVVAVCGSAILVGMQFGDVVTSPPAAGFGVVTIEYEYLGSDVWVPGGPDTVRSLLLFLCQGTNAPIHVARNNDRGPVMGAM